jgi:hypothetical protein
MQSLVSVRRIPVEEEVLTHSVVRAEVVMETVRGQVAMQHTMVEAVEVREHRSAREYPAETGIKAYLYFHT